MSDNYVQQVSGVNTTSVTVSVTSVVSGNTLVAFAFTGSTTTPTTHTVGDGQTASWTQRGSAVTDSTNTTWGGVFVLPNANSGTHSVTATFDSGNGAYIMVVEVGTTAGASAFSGSNGANQVNPGAGANALSSGSVTVTGASTLVGFAVDVSSLTVSDEPTAGTSPIAFTSRLQSVDSGLGVSILETAAASSNAAATAGPVTGSHNFITFGVAILNAAGGTDQIYPECGDWMEAAAIGEAEIHDHGPWDWYQDNTVPNRAGVEPPIPERLPESFEWIDPNETDDALFPDYWAQAPPPADVDTYVYDDTIHDSSTQLEDVDEDFAFFDAPSPAAVAPDQIWPEDASAQLEDADEDFGFADAPRAADVIVATDFIAPELGNDRPDEDEFAEGFRDDPLPDDVLDQLFNEFGHFDDPTDEPVDEGWFAAPMDVAAQPDDSSVAQECPQPLDEDDASEGFASAPLADDNDIARSLVYDASEQQEEDEFIEAQQDAPLAADNDVSAPCVTPDQADEPEDEPFGFDAQPQADDVQSDQVFTESGDWWPDDVVEEPEGFTCDPAVPELVIEEPLPFCDFPAQAEEPEDEDFGFSDFQTPDDVVPAPVTTQVVGSGGKGKKRKQASTGPSYADQFKDELARLREAEALRERIAQEDEEILALVAGFVSVITR